jgi:hypothetical protein
VSILAAAEEYELLLCNASSKPLALSVMALSVMALEAEAQTRAAIIRSDCSQCSRHSLLGVTNLLPASHWLKVKFESYLFKSTVVVDIGTKLPNDICLCLAVVYMLGSRRCIFVAGIYLDCRFC